ncbi:hypothetical protein B1L07_01710 [Stenotrophomonas acidaminiphila]|nr:hypothetical protein B1L07_01710 [Stenotrophomonas acidaminiphila]
MYPMPYRASTHRFPSPHTPWRRHRRAALLVAAISAWWLLYGLMLASQLVDMTSATGDLFTWRRALIHAAGSTAPWIPLTLLPPMREILVTSVGNNLILGITVVAMLHGIVYFEQNEQRQQQLDALEKNLAMARLEAVKARLNPHFLFNALNSVAELMQVDVEQAERMLIAISDMLRDGLRADQHHERPLRDELRQVADYLMIEGIRLGRRLRSRVDVDDACMDIPVPTLSLQPLVENAIVHAIARSRAPGWVAVGGWMDGQHLHLSIENSRGTEGAREDGNGMGQRSVKERLHLLYGDRARLEVHDAGPDVYRVHLCNDPVISCSGVTFSRRHR